MRLLLIQIVRTGRDYCIRVLFRTLYPLRLLYWFIFRPHYRGTKVIVRCGDELLFVRHSYGPQRWTFPGGGVKRGESYEEGARREVCEEVGISAPTLIRVGSFTADTEYHISDVEVYLVEVRTKEHLIDHQEIAESRWAPLSALPKPHSPGLAVMLDMVSR